MSFSVFTVNIKIAHITRYYYINDSRSGRDGQGDPFVGVIYMVA